MWFIVATNVVASQPPEGRPPERRPTGTPTARANVIWLYLLSQLFMDGDNLLY